MVGIVVRLGPISTHPITIDSFYKVTTVIVACFLIHISTSTIINTYITPLIAIITTYISHLITIIAIHITPMLK